MFGGLTFEENEVDITSRLRRTRATMLGTDDEQHFFDCHEAAVEIEKLRGLLLEVVDELDEDQAPGHNHAIPGVWDRDNGILAGKPCKWCETWAEVRAEVMGPNVKVTGAPAHGD